MRTNPGGIGEQRQPLSRMRVFVLRVVSSLLAAIDRKAPIPGIHVDFSSSVFSLQLIGLLLNKGVRRMLKEKQCRAADMVLSSIGAFIDRAIGYRKDANMAGGHRMYSDIVFEVVSQKYS